MTNTTFLAGIALLTVLASCTARPTDARPAASHASGGGIAAQGRGGLSTVPQCRTTWLRASIGGRNAGAGSIFTTLVLRNVSHVTCSLTGYPGVSLVDSRRRQIGVPARWDGGVVRRVVLSPGGAASTMMRSLNPGVGTSDCLPPSAALRIYPPNQRTPLFVPARLSECLHTLDVKPVVAGTSGS